jgi:hypothetical protein
MPKLSPEQEQYLLDHPIIETPELGELGSNRSKYVKWKCRYPGYEVIIRHGRMGRDPVTDQPIRLPGRRVRFKQGECFIPKADPEFDMVVAVLKRKKDFLMGNLVCVEEYMAQGSQTEEPEAEFLGQKDVVPLMRAGVHPSQMGRIQKLLNKQSAKREEVLKARIAALEAQIAEKKRGSNVPQKETGHGAEL